MKRIRLSTVCLAAPVALVLGSCGFLPRKARDIHQAVWVTRWDYKTEADVRDVIRNCARAGFDTVLFQVRGNGTVAYRSHIEPWSEVYGFQDPGFDPLGVACDEARHQGVSLQAWINAVPGWRGERPPANDRQLYHTRPDWFLVDEQKKREPLRKDRYVWLNPCLPEVRDYIARVCEEIVLRYPVDGIHLDYIRLGKAGKGHDYPRDERTLELYRQETGKTPDEDPTAWVDWRIGQINRLVRDIGRTVRRASRRCLLTCAVFRTPERARGVFQDWVTWVDRGWVDAVFPMTYDDDDSRFAATLAAQKEAAGDRPLIVGIGAYKHADPAQTLRQMDAVRRAGLQGYALFAYSSFFRSRAPAKPAEATARVLRRDRILPRIQSGRVAR